MFITTQVGGQSAVMVSQRMRGHLLGALLLSLSHVSDALIPPFERSSCKNIPGDRDWPSSGDWAGLNDTLGGRLIETVPQAHICHLEPYQGYNETSCEALQDAWNSPQTLWVYSRATTA